jgi:hypothetical protein
MKETTLSKITASVGLGGNAAEPVPVVNLIGLTADAESRNASVL